MARQTKKQFLESPPELQEKNRERRLAKARERSRAWYAANGDRVRAESRAWRAANVEESRRMSREWRASNPDYARELHLRRYGLTIEAWNALFASQGNSCGACRSTEPGSTKGWHTDHDHLTGAVRGILCNRCNTALGMMGDTASGVAILSAHFHRYLSGSINSDKLPANAGLLFCM